MLLKHVSIFFLLSLSGSDKNKLYLYYPILYQRKDIINEIIQNIKLRMLQNTIPKPIVDRNLFIIAFYS